MLERADAGTAAPMSHQGPVTEDTDDNTTDLSTYLEGYFVYSTVDGNSSFLHIECEEGKEAIVKLRALNGKDDKWKPKTLPASHALQRLLNQHRAQKVRQHGALGRGATTDLDWLVKAELQARRVAILRGKTIVETPKPDEGEDGGDALAVVHKTPAKMEINSPDEHGIVYLTSEHYLLMSAKDKSSTTRRINKKRLEKGLEKCIPPAKGTLEGEGEDSTAGKSKKGKKNDGTVAKNKISVQEEGVAGGGKKQRRNEG